MITKLKKNLLGRYLAKLYDHTQNITFSNMHNIGKISFQLDMYHDCTLYIVSGKIWIAVILGTERINTHLFKLSHLNFLSKT
jgi:hypothetical protein